MANLVIDIGNTLTKIAVFRQDELLQFEQYQAADAGIILALAEKYAVGQAIVASVRKGAETWQEAVGEKLNLKYFGVDMAVGIVNHYKTPETLGPDRLAAVIGAHRLYPGQGNLVIGAGTAITYDYVDAAGNYSGGSISPGLKMRYRALNYYTGALPLVDADESFDSAYGDDTTSAIRSGVQNGIKYELKGFIESYRPEGSGSNVILSGGDCNFFDTLLKNSIFAPYVKIEPHLVLKGLNAVIQHDND
ncbi:MAG: type III pantothenate kinase [Bacteroidetes bacterium]|nr:type III pantothenate kinase [Bacteroidota bacterium]